MLIFRQAVLRGQCAFPNIKETHKKMWFIPQGKHLKHDIITEQEKGYFFSFCLDELVVMPSAHCRTWSVMSREVTRDKWEANRESYQGLLNNLLTCQETTWQTLQNTTDESDIIGFRSESWELDGCLWVTLFVLNWAKLTSLFPKSCGGHRGEHLLNPSNVAAQRTCPHKRRRSTATYVRSASLIRAFIKEQLNIHSPWLKLGPHYEANPSFMGWGRN